jgi:hypothetical protein
MTLDYALLLECLKLVCLILIFRLIKIVRLCVGVTYRVMVSRDVLLWAVV